MWRFFWCPKEGQNYLYQQQQQQQQQLQQQPQLQQQWQQQQQQQGKKKEFTLFPDSNLSFFSNGSVAGNIQPTSTPARKHQPLDLRTLLLDLGLAKYIATFEEQDVDLHVFLSLTDSDLKEIGIKWEHLAC